MKKTTARQRKAEQRANEASRLALQSAARGFASLVLSSPSSPALAPGGASAPPGFLGSFSPIFQKSMSCVSFAGGAVAGGPVASSSNGGGFASGTGSETVNSNGVPKRS